MNKNFIKTSDESVAEELRKCGYQELNKEGKYFVFLNNGKMNFSTEMRKKMVCTDKVCI